VGKAGSKEKYLIEDNRKMAASSYKFHEKECAQLSVCLFTLDPDQSSVYIGDPDMIPDRSTI
jgi:hypothetical protein